MLSEQILKDRVGNFTASENHRAMAGWNKPAPEPFEPYLQPLYDYIKPRYDAGEREFRVGAMKAAVPTIDSSVVIIKSVLDVIKADVVPEGLITYAREKAVESLFNVDPSLNWSTAHTRNGNEREVKAMLMLSDRTELNFVRIGEDQAHVQVNGIGCTPDGVVLDEVGLISVCAEVKCKSAAEHAKLFVINNNADMIDKAFDHYVQVQTQMLVTETKQCHFAIYNPFAKYDWLEFKNIVIDRDDKFIAILSERLELAKKIKAEFLAELVPGKAVSANTDKIIETNETASLTFEV
jgi:hypothetical protein